MINNILMHMKENKFINIPYDVCQEVEIPNEVDFSIKLIKSTGMKRISETSIDERINNVPPGRSLFILPKPIVFKSHIGTHLNITGFIVISNYYFPVPDNHFDMVDHRVILIIEHQEDNLTIISGNVYKNIYFPYGFMLGTPYNGKSKNISHVYEIIQKTLIFFWFTAQEEQIIIDKKNKKYRLPSLNGSKYPENLITIIDKNYYTKTTVANPFNVRTHWALRACGKGRTERKVVEIQGYQKKGYVRESIISQH